MQDMIRADLQHIPLFQLCPLPKPSLVHFIGYCVFLCGGFCDNLLIVLFVTLR